MDYILENSNYGWQISNYAEERYSLGSFEISWHTANVVLFMNEVFTQQAVPARFQQKTASWIQSDIIS